MSLHPDLSVQTNSPGIEPLRIIKGVPLSDRSPVKLRRQPKQNESVLALISFVEGQAPSES